MPGGRRQPIRPSRRPTATAYVREDASSLELMLRRWVRTVLSDTQSFAAMAALNIFSVTPPFAAIPAAILS